MSELPDDLSRDQRDPARRGWAGASRRCQMQFNALERLLQEDDPADVQSGRFLRPATAPAAPAAHFEPPPREDITLEGDSPPSDNEDARPAQEIEVESQPHEAAAEWIEIEDHAAQLPEADEPLAEAQTEDEPPPAFAESSKPPISPAPAPIARSAAPEAHAPEFDLGVRPKRRSAPVWRFLAPLLLLLLIVQAVHHWRAALAREPSVGEALMSAYAALGLELTPEWDLHAYEIRQWGVVSDPSQPGTLRVRASITNTAPIAQPYPLLKLVLEDRWGDQVRAREFTPSEYLDPAIAPDRLLGPAQQTNATITIVDPGPDAEGFRFDVCLNGRRGTVCAEDIPRSAGG